MKTINGQILKLMLISGSNNLYNHYPEIDALNVFPVPDGDTGMNMNLTLTSGAKEIQNRSDTSVGDIAKVFSRGLLMGARGNSGVITSQIFRGFASELAGKEEINVVEFVSALKRGSEVAYKAVVKPVEGTILTVIRETSQFLSSKVKSGMNFSTMFDLLLKEADTSLKHTPELLPILKEVGVVDSGGAGLIKIFEGMKASLNGSLIERNLATAMENEENEELDKKEKSEYYIELLCNLKAGIKKKNFEETKFLNGLNSRGNEISIKLDDYLLKVHIHSFTPGNVINFVQQYGEFETIKIENLKNGLPTSNLEVKQNKPKSKYAIIAVSSGKGIDDYFKTIGVNVIVKGGQTMNPSAEDFLAAIKEANAENIFILPNNSNIVMAASQACEVLEDDSVHAFVIPTKTIPQGITAAISFNSEETPEENFKEMKAALKHIKSGEVTFAIRDTEINGVSVKKDDYIAIMDKNIVSSNRDLIDTTLTLIDHMVSDEDSIITVLVGEDVSNEDKEKIKKILVEKYEDLDVDIVSGGQPVYSFLIGVE